MEDTPFGPVDVWWQVVEVRGAIVRTEIHYRFASSGEEMISANVLRFRTRADLSQSLADAGFSVGHVYGNWNRAPVNASSPELIFVATRQ